MGTTEPVNAEDLLKTNPNDLSGRMAEQTRDHCISFILILRGHEPVIADMPTKDVIVAVIKEGKLNTILERSEVIRAIVRTRKELKRDNGMIIRYDDNAAVVIDQEGNPKGTRIFGAIARELRQLNFTK
ncbi:50S ribosomal protein L14, chloroplastic-like [Gossypium arboreum]|uniref:50S ribosomal protein L14, chloroplastic-like n=1 Tax=Gossypium arboreum TaxID=29729 RepID=UPI0022F15E25|nr:50S ribosomal protein L14, chloroplastic-like [Gossypium arboreum]